MNHRNLLLATSIVAALAGGVGAQATTVDKLIENRWPGDSIRKVSEADFLQFIKRAGVTDRKAATRAFLSAQYRAYGLPADASLDFPVPSFRTGDVLVSETSIVASWLAVIQV